MGEYETPVKQFNADTILLTDNTSAVIAAGTAGRVCVSGGALYVSDGSGWVAT